MMNLSSLSKAAIWMAAAGGCVAVVGIARLLLGPDLAPWDTIVEFVSVPALLGLAVRSLQQTAGSIHATSDICERASRGDLEARILGIRDPGELGKMQASVNDMLDIADAFLREATGSMEYVSRGKYFRKVLTRGLPGSFGNGATIFNAGTEAMDRNTRELARVAQGVRASMDKVGAAVSELQGHAESIAASAEQTSRQSTAVAEASEEASSNVQTVASAAEELSASIAEIGQQVARSTTSTNQAVAEADRTNAEIAKLAEAAQRIGDVVKLINEIAGQTNLLALNATIEAARAGEVGKGFAVVASEVKSLARQTAKATEEIGLKIAEMQTATERSVSAVEAIGQTIGEINLGSTTIAAAIEEQGAATKEIARNVLQASTGAAEVSSNIAGISQGASDTGQIASRVNDASGKISGEVDTLRKEVEKFLASIKAA